MKDISIISSRDNSRLVAARKVRDGKFRDKMFIEGVRLAEETLRSGVPLNECFVTQGFAETERGSEILKKLLAESVPVSEVSISLFRSIADTANSQGIVLIVPRPACNSDSIDQSSASKGSPVVVLLHEINDPSNLGAVVRTAEAAGVAGIIITKQSADVFSPKALRAAMGSSLRVPVWESANLSEALIWARSRGFAVTAADIQGQSEYTEIDWTLPHLLVFGSEAHGLSRETLNEMDEVAVIPMQNGVESLNLAVSAGVLLFEVLRQRSTKNNVELA